MLKLPFFTELEPAQNILIAGAGGGFDIFSGLPLYFGLHAAGKNVHLANLSFSILPHQRDERLASALLRVTDTTPLVTDYFPEKYLAQWFRLRGQDVPIYCFERTGVRPMLAGYQALVDRLGIDTIILVDGGTDSLMRGDESGLGTPQEDMASITAVHELNVARKLLVCLGFGIDHYHGVCHAHFLEAVAAMISQQGYLGMFSLTKDMPEVALYQAATEHVFTMMPNAVSIVSSSILSAIDGHYGDYQVTERTRNSQLWINPLMAVYWCFQLAPVAERLLYRQDLLDTNSYREVAYVIEAFRYSCKKIRPAMVMPV
jgi:hypothetical protein